jgi:hypothetical protein
MSILRFILLMLSLKILIKLIMAMMSGEAGDCGRRQSLSLLSAREGGG